MPKMLIKRAILCAFLIMLVTPLAKASAGSQPTSSAATFDPVSLASQFLQAVGFNSSDYKVPPSVQSYPNESSSLNTFVSATVHDEHGDSVVSFEFINGTFWSYVASLKSIDTSPERSFSDLLNGLITVVSDCAQISNDTYWNDFGQLISTAQQTQQLTGENQNFSLEIQNDSTLGAICYEKIDGNYTCPSESVQVYMTRTGFINSIWDHLAVYHVVTTNVTVSKEQAVAIAEPYFTSFAQENQVNITAINATLSYKSNQYAPRSDGYGEFAVYPVWFVEVEYDKVAPAFNARSYGVLIWADNGAIITYGPEAFFTSEPSNNVFTSLPLLLIASVFTFAICMGAYFHRKRRSVRYRAKLFKVLLRRDFGFTGNTRLA